MKARMASMYGKMDIRLREVELPEIKEDEILIKVISNGICNSTYKACKAGKEHLRIPNDVDINPIVTGHEFAGIIFQVGKKWENQYKVGQSCLLQAGIRYKGSEDAPGYSFPYFGGNTTYTIIPGGYIEMGCLLTYDKDYYAFASMAEPISCTIGGFHACFHELEVDWPTYEHSMGIKSNGTLALLAACGPMGISAIDYAIHGPFHPRKVVVTDINEKRIARAKELLPIQEAKELGIELVYLNMTEYENPKEILLEETDNEGFDDIIVFAPSKEVIELGASVLRHHGCLNFFAGPIDKEFMASVNFYDIHYSKKRYVGNSGGNLDDIQEMLSLSLSKKMHPEFMITHVAGLQEAPNIIMNFPTVPGSKKLIYTHTDIPLMAMEDFKNYPEDACFRQIADILDKNQMVWNEECEKLLLKYKSID